LYGTPRQGALANEKEQRTKDGEGERDDLDEPKSPN